MRGFILLGMWVERAEKTAASEPEPGSQTTQYTPPQGAPAIISTCMNERRYNLPLPPSLPFPTHLNRLQSTILM